MWARRRGRARADCPPLNGTVADLYHLDVSGLSTTNDDDADPSVAVLIRDVVKRYGRATVLDGVSLAVRRGEIYGLLGPNGAGKTTLIRCVVGLVRPDAGAVRTLGHSMPNVAVLARVGYMTQAAALYPDLSVLENVRFFAAISGHERDVDEALRTVAMEDRRRAVVATLSGGMRARVSLACAIVHQPELLLLDEPTVGVDPALRAQLWDRFRAMAAAGAALVVSSHVMDEAERCDRLGLMLSGRLLAEGSADELRRLAGSQHLEDAFLRLATDRPA
jgi:ABC-2 type transport system ATP-binding protein